MVGLLVAAACFVPPAQTADAIMFRVACNQQRALDRRKEFVYRQKTLMRMHRGNGKLAREERREYTVTPTPNGFHKELAHFDGKYVAKGKTVAYDKPGFQYKGIDVDGQVLDQLDDSLTNQKDSRDGYDADLFPLTANKQTEYQFHLAGQETEHGRPVYRIEFEPRKGGDSSDWKGEVLVDAKEYQPVFVATKLAWGMPFVVRTLLGTNIRGLGFSLAYQKFDDGVWFPVSYGGEFQVKVFFFYTRNVSVSIENRDFQRTDVTSRIQFASVAP